MRSTRAFARKLISLLPPIRAPNLRSASISTTNLLLMGYKDHYASATFAYLPMQLCRSAATANPACDNPSRIPELPARTAGTS